MTHLNALRINLSNERARMETAKSEAERELRSVWVIQLEKEIAAEMKFLGFVETEIEISDDDLFNELTK